MISVNIFNVNMWYSHKTATVHVPYIPLSKTGVLPQYPIKRYAWLCFTCTHSDLKDVEGKP